MPNHAARTKASKSKKLSVQRILTRSNIKDRDDRQEQMDIDTGVNGDHAASDNDQDFSQHSITKNLTDKLTQNLTLVLIVLIRTRL